MFRSGGIFEHKISASIFEPAFAESLCVVSAGAGRGSGDTVGGAVKGELSFKQFKPFK
jgi:hypothetical protein